MKSVIVRDLRGEGGRVTENAEFLRFAAHCGFRVRACRPYRAKTKGKVERPIGYVRKSFAYGRSLAGDADLNAQAEWWLGSVANVRVHRTIRERPAERLERDERHVLRPLRPPALPLARAARRTGVREGPPALASVPRVTIGLGGGDATAVDAGEDGVEGFEHAGELEVGKVGPAPAAAA